MEIRNARITSATLGRETMAFCSGCGYAVKISTMFVKQYKNTAFCLCRKCALELGREIADTVEKSNAK